ncbi:tetratricopeptide repeat protein [Corallococcus sp. M34]|uniref:tetratricopeptide repeat protein n=1 Tax=Citreicoccus inhibens TaxID=2849499 RepID=UPI001C24B1F2|nr:tetratricopeptide repeat protein [Citreicoccus inhibens]MBU8897417.1 tetratricopeptide repeat protein [Citreicoccus inhibens]
MSAPSSFVAPRAWGWRSRWFVLGLSCGALACASAKPAVVTPPTPPVVTAPPPPPPEKTADALFAEALAAYEAGDLDTARAGFEKALAKAPQALNAQFNLGVIAQRQGRMDDARAAYEKALFLDPAHTPSVLNLGGLERQQGRADEAIALYARALKAPKHEDDVAVLDALTAAYAQAKKFDLAESTARRVLSRHKDHPEAYKNLALIAYERGQFRLAELLLLDARKGADKDPAIANTLGMVYLKLDDRARALAQFQRAVSLDAKFVPGFLNLGALALSYRDYAGAERAFSRALELEPGAQEAQLYLAYALDGQKGREPKKGIAAGEAFERVLAQRPDQPEALCGAGWAYAAERTGWQKAIAFLERCRGLPSTSAQDQQLIQAKTQGLRNMMKSTAQATPAPEGGHPDKKPGPPAAGGGGSVLEHLPQDPAAEPAPTGTGGPAGDAPETPPAPSPAPTPGK